MAKEKKKDITFDKLTNLDLSMPTTGEADEVKESTTKKKVPVKDTVKTSFKMERDVHLALKHYSLVKGKDMATLVFDEIVKSFLEDEGYYPPRK